MKIRLGSAMELLVATVLGGMFPMGASTLDTNQIDRLTGLKGKLNVAEGVYKVSAPRTDVKVSVDGWALPPFMGLTSWASFKSGTDKEAMVMGDLVLLEDEVNAALSAALDSGLEVTALHNHFFFDNPRVYFMHIGGDGKLDDLARGVRAALAASQKARGQNAAGTFGHGPLPNASSISSEKLEKIFGAKGESKDGMFKAVFGRQTKMSCGCDAGKEMGVNTWAAFGGSDDNAVVDGDFVVLANELHGVLKSLRQSQINIVAIHHHMTDETPRLIFLHYWGRGRAADLATAIKIALDKTQTNSHQ